MGKLLLVAVTPDEETTLCAAVGPESCRAVAVTDLKNAIDADADAVAVGTEAPSPLAAVQWVHRAQPLCGVVLLTTPENDAELRRSAMYAPDMPASLTIVESLAPDLPAQAKEALEAGRLRRRHQETLAAVSSMERVSTPHALAPASHAISAVSESRRASSAATGCHHQRTRTTAATRPAA